MEQPAAIRAIDDPVERIRAAQAAIDETRHLTSEYSAITRETVREMRESMSYGEVAKALGVSRTRIQQLERS